MNDAEPEDTLFTPTKVGMWKGKPVEALNRQELMECISYLGSDAYEAKWNKSKA